MTEEVSLIGRQVGNYKVIGEIGRGGMGVVYRAHEESLQRDVALKVLRLYFAQDAVFVKRFTLEGRSAARLSHPNVVHVYAVGEHEGHYYIAMEYVRGRTLSDYIQIKGQVELNKALYVTREVAKALAAAHQQRMVHRDIKPDNIMIDMSGHVKVMDFGLAKAIQQKKGLTDHGVVIGTPQYMSPEQVRGVKTDERTDIYSLGVTLFEMLAGRPPFVAPSRLSAMYQIVEQPLPSLRSFNPSVPQAVEAVVEKMAAKNPGDRYASAREASVDLRILLRGGDPLETGQEGQLLDAAFGEDLSETHGFELDDGLRDELIAIRPSSHLIQAPPHRSTLARVISSPWELLLGVTNVLLLALCVYLTLKGLILTAGELGSSVAIRTVRELLDTRLLTARLVCAAALMVVWPFSFLLALRFTTEGHERSRPIVLTGIIFALLAYLASWCPLPLASYALLGVLLLFLLPVTIACRYRPGRVAVVWLLVCLAVVGAAVAALAAVEGGEGVKALPKVVRYARTHDGVEGAGEYVLSVMQGGSDRSIVWDSTGIPWLDRKAAEVVFEVIGKSAIRPAFLELKDDSGTVYYHRISDAEFRSEHPIRPNHPYRLVVGGPETSRAEVRIYSILKPRF
ncbi:MAG: protein kinase [Nitrospiraceae bacterium]|nr:protein kinase [Nitrospiraceae bacterium]